MGNRISVARDLAVARRRVWALTPFSPSWDAAMAIVEDLERALWQLDHPAYATETDRGGGEVVLQQIPA